MIKPDGSSNGRGGNRSEEPTEAIQQESVAQSERDAETQVLRVDPAAEELAAEVTEDVAVETGGEEPPATSRRVAPTEAPPKADGAIPKLAEGVVLKGEFEGSG